MNRYVFIIILLCVFDLAISQTQKKLSLEEAIQIAQDQSPEALLAKHKFRNSYWQFRTYSASYKPSLTMDATLPDFHRSFKLITLPDGSDTFVSSRGANSSLGFSVKQNVPFSGGQLFINSNIQRIDDFVDSTRTSYMSTPVSIGFMQPIFSYNSYKWERKIEPLKFEEAKRNYLSVVEQISQKVVGYFFDLVLAQINLSIAKTNYSNNDTLYKMSEGRYNIGTIAQNELLQMELNLLNSGTSLNQAKLSLEIAKFKLRSYLGYNDEVDIELIVPKEIPVFEINVDKAKDQAFKNNPDILSYELQLIEAESSVAKAKTENRFNANLYASYGLTQSAEGFTDTYKNPQNQQQITVGVQVPVIDWGLGRGKYKMALSSQEVVKTTINQAKIDFEQDVFLQVMQFNLQDDNVKISAKADAVAQSRYEISKQRFYIGKINVTDLTIALTEKDGAKRDYISSLRNYWNYYYSIRKLTLYDFEKDLPLTTDFDTFLK